jgi:hypothetical protein
MGRWVCLRCYESNDAALVSCAKCGLARGATPAQGDDANPADPGAAMAFPTTPAKEPNVLWGLVRRFGWVAVVVVVAAVGWWFSAGRSEGGEINRSGNLDVTELRTGDCFDLQDPDAEIIEQVDAKVCTEPHHFEMVYVADMPDGDYPSEDAMDQFAYEQCLPAFGSYVGVSYEESLYELTYVTPTEDGWGNGDHAIQCVAYHPDNEALTMSLRGVSQ